MGEVSSLLQTANKLPSPFSLMNDESFHSGQLSASQSKIPFFCGRRYLRKLSKFIIRARAVTPGLWSRGLYWLLIVTCHSVNPPPLQKRAKSCEHQRHWRWRPFTLIPRVAHSPTDSLKGNVSWIHKLIGSTTNPSSAWLLIQLLCSKNMKWAGQETGMQPWRTTHSGIYTSKGENLGKVCNGENESHKSRPWGQKFSFTFKGRTALQQGPVHLFNKPSYFFLYELCASVSAAGF